MDNETQNYASYNALSRKALIWGIPIIPLVLFLCLILTTAFVGGFLFGIYGLIIPLFLICVLFWIRIQCLEDSRAMESVWWDFKGWITRVQCRSTITSLTSTDASIKKQREVIREWFNINSRNQ